MSSSVLYDAPGPRSKRRVLIGSIIAVAALLAVVALVVRQLDKQDQFAEDKWAPLFNPSDENFVLVWQRIGEGLSNTLIAAGLAMAFSLVIGTLLAVTRVTAARWYRWAVVGLIELLRGVPVVIAIFFAARVLPELGVDLEPLWFLVIGLTAYNSVVIAEIVRAGINSLPRGQGEAAESLGMRRSQVLALVLLPQAFRAMLPALISQLVVVLKDTSLGFIIGYEEVVRVSGQIVQNLSNSIQVYLLIAVIFIIVNYALSRFAIYVERRLSQGKKTAVVDGEPATLSATAVGGAGAAGGG
ncbi:amino acid ABC transporter permease [Actinokineospora sp.]|uniref:amino acid ABC transporter permease n=1 Tax=Actinokineospora sp. TaxID=1872133 RepID=UPI0040378F71